MALDDIISAVREFMGEGQSIVPLNEPFGKEFMDFYRGLITEEMEEEIIDRISEVAQDIRRSLEDKLPPYFSRREVIKDFYNKFVLQMMSNYISLRTTTYIGEDVKEQAFKQSVESLWQLLQTLQSGRLNHTFFVGLKQHIQREAGNYDGRSPQPQPELAPKREPSKAPVGTY